MAGYIKRNVEENTGNNTEKLKEIDSELASLETSESNARNAMLKVVVKCSGVLWIGSL